jgi:hypothetical protein
MRYFDETTQILAFPRDFLASHPACLVPRLVGWDIGGHGMRFDKSVKWHGDVAEGLSSGGLRWAYHPDISRSGVRLVNSDGNPVCLSCGKELTYWGVFVRGMCSEHSRNDWENMG